MNDYCHLNCEKMHDNKNYFPETEVQLIGKGFLQHS